MYESTFGRLLGTFLPFPTVTECFTQILNLHCFIDIIIIIQYIIFLEYLIIIIILQGLNL